jgi:capsular exopolysaccharide synthesis family protein
MATKTTANRQRTTTSDSLSMKDMLMVCLRHWPWFVLSLLLFMGAATLYLLSTPKTFTRTTSIMVKNSGDKSNDIKLIEDLGVNNLSSNIADEIVAIHSPASIYEMVKRLHLDISYYRPGFFRDDPLYAATLPVEIEFDSIADDTRVNFKLKLTGDSTANISEIVLRGEPVSGTFNIRMNKLEQLPFGGMTLKPSLYYKKDMRSEILVKRVGFVSASQHYGSLISAKLQRQTRNIIDITCVDNLIARADNILKTIVNIYNENWVANRNQISISTNEFIKERLAVIEEELGDVDEDIAGYKSAHAMPSVEAVAAQAMGQESAADQQRQHISNQLYMVRYVRNYVTDPSHANQLLPASSGIGNAAVEAQIAAYNEKLLQRNNLVANSSEQNPLVADLDVTLANLKGAIVNSLDNTQATLNAQLSTVQMMHSQAIDKLSANPNQANHLLSIERQQKVKESLYLFLLQKREENELSQAFTAYNTRIIAEPFGSSAPTAPQSKNILMIAFGLALALPAAFFIIRENSNSKVRGRKDLENLSIPYVGELPLWKPKKKEEVNKHGYQIVVQHHKRDIVNEAFRVVRTNLEFMVKGQLAMGEDSSSTSKSRIIMFTSFNPGSGKTFICANLGASFGIRGSKVICIDLDLRRGSLSEFVESPRHGLTNYLGGQTDDYRELIVHQSLLTAEEEGGEATRENKQPVTLDFLPMGKIPPNPTELLYSPKLKPMLDELRKEYDYIFIDCPPVEIVADATIISREADVTLFVIRAGLLERVMLPELEKNYEDKKYNNMAILLNGTDAEHHYGYHRYGYGYGRYGSGKGHGYGYYGKS